MFRVLSTAVVVLAVWAAALLLNPWKPSRVVVFSRHGEEARSPAATQPASEGVASSSQPAGPATQPAIAPTVPMVASVPPPKPAVTAPTQEPKPPKAPEEIVEGPDRRIDKPEGQYTLEPLVAGERITLCGRVKTLKLNVVNGGATVDASALEAREIILTDAVNGHSAVKLNAPNGRVEFRKAINGQSTVEVNAPNGTVIFVEAPARPGGEGAEINGESKVTITAKDVELRSSVNGTFTRIAVTLTKGGKLRFHQLAGAVVLEYRKSDPHDPDPIVEPGNIVAAAKLRKIE